MRWGDRAWEGISRVEAVLVGEGDRHTMETGLQGPLSPQHLLSLTLELHMVAQGLGAVAWWGGTSVRRSVSERQPLSPPRQSPFGGSSPWGLH